MLPIKLVRSLVLGETMTNPFNHDHHNAADDEHKPDITNHNNNNNKIPMLLFIPNNELITDTFRLASLARDLGMHFHPSPSLSHLIFSWPTSSPPTSSPSTTVTSSSSSSPSKRSSLFINEGAPLPFPSLSTPTVSLSLLRFFVSLSRGLFKLVFYDAGPARPGPGPERGGLGLGLCSRVSGCRVGSMDELCREMVGHGWAMFRTHRVVHQVYLFQKRDCNRVRVRVGVGNGECCRVRELRLPLLDFRNGVDLKILLYILLMTDDDDIFYLA